MTDYVATMNKESSPAVTQWSWRLLMVLAAGLLFFIYGQVFDVYEIGIVIFTAVSLSLLGQNWPGFRKY